MEDSTQQSTDVIPTSWTATFAQGMTGWGSSVGNWYQQAKESMRNVFNEPETPIFMQAMYDPAFAEFRNFQEWCCDIKLKMREVKEVLDRGGVDPAAFKKALLAAQEPLEETIILPFHYHQQLTKLATKRRDDPKIPNVFADIVCEADARLIEKLVADIDKAERYFYDDLMNHIVGYGGINSQPDELQVLLSYYENLVDHELHQTLSDHVSDFVNYCEDYFEKHMDSVTGTLFVVPPNKSIKELLRNIDQAFSNFENQDCQEDECVRKNQLQTDAQSNYQKFKTYLHSGFNYVKENPKTIFASATATAATTYLCYYATGTNHSNTLTTSQFPQWTSPSWLPTNTFTNAFANAAITYGLSTVAVGRGFAVPSAFVIGVLLQPYSLGARADLNDGLFAYYPLDNDVNDYSGNGYNGTVVGNITYTSGRVDQSGEFDGSSYVRLLTFPTLRRPFSCSLWFRAIGDKDWRSIMENHQECSGSYGGFGMYLIGERFGSKFRLYNSNNPPSNIINYDGIFYDGQWHNAIAIFSNGSFSLYFDGQLIDTPSNFYTETTNILEIGHNSYSLCPTPVKFTGFIDDVRFYNRTLTNTEVTSLYNLE